MSALAIFVVTVLGLAIMLGIIRPRNVLSVVAAFIITIPLLSVFLVLAAHYWAHASAAQRSLMLLVGLPLVGLLIIRLVFGRLVSAILLALLLYDALRWAIRWLIVGAAAGTALLGGILLKLWALIQAGWL
jgi:hypothetical protein